MVLKDYFDSFFQSGWDNFWAARNFPFKCYHVEQDIMNALTNPSDDCSNFTKCFLGNLGESSYYDCSLLYSAPFDYGECYYDGFSIIEDIEETPRD